VGFEKPVWVLCVTHMFIDVYSLIHVALIPVYIREFNLGLLEASLVATVPSLVQLLMNIPSGLLANHLNAKQLLSVSMIIEGVSALFVSQTNNFWLLIVAVSVMKISSPVYHVSGLSQLSRLVSPERTSRSVGLHGAFGSLGSAMGVVSLAFFLSSLGWRWTYLAWAFPIIAWGFIASISSQPETRVLEKQHLGKKDRLSAVLTTFSAGLVIFIVVIGLREVGITSISTFMTTYLVRMRGLPEATASLIFGLGPFIGIVGSLNSGYLGEKLNPKRALGLTIIGCVMSLSLMAVCSQLYLLTIVYLLYRFFSDSVWVPINTIVAHITPGRQREFGYSAYLFTEGLVMSVAPIAAAKVIELSSIWYIFPFSIVFLAMSLAVLQILPRSTRHGNPDSMVDLGGRTTSQ